MEEGNSKEVSTTEANKWQHIEWVEFKEELKKVSSIAGPMVAVSVMQYLLQVVSVMMVGHLGKLALSSIAIATSLTNVTGFSLHSGLVGALEMLCGQAYGAKQSTISSVSTHILPYFSMILVCAPVSILWIFMDKVLILMKQDAVVSCEARKYALLLIPSLVGGAISKPFVRHMQAQSLVLPMLACSFLVLCSHVAITWTLIFKFHLRSNGAAIALCITSWLYVILLMFYVGFSKSTTNTRLILSIKSFYVLGLFFRLAIPSAVMVCLKWWALELLVILSGLLPNPTLETSVLSICLTISMLNFTLSYGIGVAASTQVSNEFGAGNPHRARVAIWACMFLTGVEAITVSITLFLCRTILGWAYSNEAQVAMTPFIRPSIVTDSLQAVNFRGSGWQRLGAYVNVGAFYLVGIPVAILLGFGAHLKAKGFWIGILIGSIIQSLVLLLKTTFFTNWEKQATEAKERISKG